MIPINGQAVCGFLRVLRFAPPPTGTFKIIIRLFSFIRAAVLTVVVKDAKPLIYWSLLALQTGLITPHPPPPSRLRSDGYEI